MNRRNTLKTLAATAGGIAGLSLIEWKWHILEDFLNPAFFSRKEQALLAAIADTIIPPGPARLPAANAPTSEARIGALSSDTDQYLMKVLEKCYEKEVHDNVKAQLALLDKKAESAFGEAFNDCSQQQREELLLGFSASEQENEKEFFDLLKKEVITGFTTCQEVMVNYLEYKIAPGKYDGCAELLS